ncbi:MAG: glyoxalase [Rhodanobacteraceae bacterium]|nr:MAG: glyoxalase [Rhodanobacteraceae bacterium]
MHGVEPHLRRPPLQPAVPVCLAGVVRDLGQPARRGAAMSHGVQALLRIGRNTADLDRALAFYCDALGFRVDDANAAPPAWTRLPGAGSPPTRCAQLSLGAQRLELTEFADAEPYPADSDSCDLWFQHCAIVVNDMQAVCTRATQHGAAPISRDGPQHLPPFTGSVIAWKFRDPDGHPLELIHFPAGTGDPIWQALHTYASTLGIDHSAISVGDAQRSIAFHELLGLYVASHGLNRGFEQQRLDDLDDVEVDVVALQGTTRAPHLELLGYRQPRGRANPSTDTTGIAADRVIWQAQGIDVLLDALTDGDFTDAIIASGFVDGAIVALLRDPDGHLVVLDESE